MPAGPANIGVTEASNSFVQAVDIESKMDEVVRKDKNGGFAVAHAFDPKITGSIKILGASSDAVGGDLTTALASITDGITIINEKSRSRTNDNFDETTVGFQNWPGAGGN